jgi:tetratricopeptide (TPR) repeat protein
MLFTAQDNDRMAPMIKKLEEGLAHAKKKEYEDMEKRFREILALQPMFERKSEMVKGYMDAAHHYIGKHNYERASFLLRVARRINSDPEKDDKIHAMIYYTDAMRDLEDGVADPDLMRKAVKLDPDFEEAREKLEEIEKIYRGRKIKGYRILAAGGIGTTALLILLLILLKRW